MIACGAGGEIQPNAKHRILVWYGEKLCPIVRFAISKDGSINFAPYLKGATEIAIQRLTAGEHGELEVKYGMGEVLTKDEIRDGNPLKVNYHASGFIHYGNERRQGTPLRGLQSQIEIAMILIMHPQEMGLIATSAVRKTDMVAKLQVKEANPLHLRLLVTPKTHPFAIPDIAQQVWVQCMDAKNLIDGTPDLLYSFHLIEGATGPWPLECGVFFPVKQSAESDQ